MNIVMILSPNQSENKSPGGRQRGEDALRAAGSIISFVVIGALDRYITPFAEF